MCLELFKGLESMDEKGFTMDISIRAGHFHLYNRPVSTVTDTYTPFLYTLFTS